MDLDGGVYYTYLSIKKCIEKKHHRTPDRLSIHSELEKDAHQAAAAPWVNIAPRKKMHEF